MELINPQNLQLSHTQFMQLLPYFILMLGAMAAVLMGVTRRFQDLLVSKAITVASGLLAMYAVFYGWGEPAGTVFNRMLAVDSFSSLFHIIFLISAILVTISSFPYLKKQEIEYPEYYGLVLFAAMGMMLMASSLDLVVMFVALEIMSIAVYVLVGFRRTDVRSNEAALKYFILGSAASAIFLFGIALLYGATGTMQIQDMAALVKSSTGSNPLFILGASLVLVGFLFKVAAAPFHMWMPDVYEGAPTTITNFMTTGLKAAAFAAFVRVFASLGYITVDVVLFKNVLWIVAVLTMVLGNVIALTQTNIKRMLAYSSISHTGYLIVGMIAAAKAGGAYYPVIVYLVGYAMSNLGAFAILAYLSGKGDTFTDLHDIAGLGFKKPLLGFAMMIFMFSMAGVPPTAGFIGKYLMLSAAVQTGEISLTIIAVLCSAVSAYYYLRIIVLMYMKDAVREYESLSSGLIFIVVFTALMTIQVGMLPSGMIAMAQQAASIFAAN